MAIRNGFTSRQIEEMLIHTQPYAGILVTAAAEDVAQALVDQLADGGIMVLPLGPHAGPQYIVRLTKAEGEVRRENLIGVRFVPLLPGQAREL